MNAGVPSNIRVSVTFLDRESGGREQPPFDGPFYRPHLVVGDPGLRSALYDANGHAAEHYLGVQFMGDGKQLVPGIAHDVVLKLCYLGSVDYSSLVEGATFTVRELT